MFKKLVVGLLATGIALTGGIGAASADTQKAVSSPKQAACSIPYEYSNGKFKRTLYYSNGYMLIVLMKMFVAGRLHGI